MPLSTRRDTRATRRSIGLREEGNAYARSESGIGALMPWANKLWLTTYPDENGNGSGTGLFSLDEDGHLELVEETNKTHAGRAISGEYAFIGEHKIHQDGTAIRMAGFETTDRITAWAVVPGQIPNSEGYVWTYCLTMGGRIYRILNDDSTEVVFVGDASTAFNISGQAHFKAMWGTPTRLYVVSNINNPDGRFGYYHIPSSTFTRLDNSIDTRTTGMSYIEVSGSYDGFRHAFALGQDNYTGYLYLINGNDSSEPRIFLIPLPSRQQVFGWQQEWMRIRQADTTERFIMDFHGGYFALSPFLDGEDNAATGLPRIEALGNHSRTTTDWAVFDGKLWLASNASSTQNNNRYPNGGQSQSILWGVESVDELLSHTRKARASGWFYRARQITTDESYMMMSRGYDRKMFYYKNGSETVHNITLYGYWGTTKQPIEVFEVTANELVTFQVPDGMNPDWFSIQSDNTVPVVSSWIDFS